MRKIYLLVTWLIVGVASYAQSYVSLGDQSGLTISQSRMAELEASANSIKAILPIEYREQFAVYDFGYYLYNELMIGENSVNGIWDQQKASINKPYYLLFGRESSQDGKFDKVRIELKLPSGGPFQCMDGTYLEIIKNAVTLPTKTALENGVSSGSLSAFVDAEIESMNNLRVYITRLTNCCNNGQWNINCGKCIYDFNEINTLLRTKGYVRLSTDRIDLTNTTYPAIQFDKKIMCIFQGESYDFTQDLENLKTENGSDVTISVREINSTNCEIANTFQEIRSSVPYTEDVILVNFGEGKALYTKISLPSGGQRKVLPWLAAQLLKRIAMAATGGVIDVGVQTLMEWYIGGHPSFSVAWENTNIDLYQVLASAGEAAISDKKFAEIVIPASLEVIKWIRNTPFSSYIVDNNIEGARSLEEGPNWITELGKVVVKEFGSSVVQVVVLKKVDKFVKVFEKYSSNFSSTLKSKLPIIAQDIFTRLPSNRIVPFLKRWKELVNVLPLFNSNSDLVRDPIYLEKIMDAVKGGDVHRLLIQKGLGGKASGTVLGSNLSLLARGPKVGCIKCQAHHIVPGGETSAAAIQLRAKLQHLGIDINEAANGVYLPLDLHTPTFRQAYENQVLRDLANINDADGLRKALGEIAKKLEAGVYI